MFKRITILCYNIIVYKNLLGIDFVCVSVRYLLIKGKMEPCQLHQQSFAADSRWENKLVFFIVCKASLALGEFQRTGVSNLQAALINNEMWNFYRWPFKNTSFC